MNIVVVDDDPVIRLLLTRTVEWLGHQVYTAEAATEALALMEEKSIDVVISDWMMPGCDGMELCSLVRNRDSLEYVYFILATSMSDRENAMTALRGGVDDYLVKPVDRYHLQLRLIVAERVTDLHRRLAHQMGVLERIGVEAEASARIDLLTGLGNRRRLEEDLEVLIARRERYKETFGVALMDLDHFRTINDTAGHLAGDEALRRVGRIVGEQLRQSDMAFRYGGEEFLVAVSGDIRRAATAADRIRRAVEAAAIPHPGRPAPGSVVTLSVGVAAAEGDPKDFLRAADDALYRAKSEGRNCTAIAVARTSPSPAGPVGQVS